MEDSIQLIKLTTNETIVCQIIEENEFTIVVRIPYKVTAIGIETNKPKMALIKWDHLIETAEDIVLNKNTIVATCMPIEELYNVYEELLVKHDMPPEAEAKLTDDLETIERLLLEQINSKDTTTH
tara:strand:- start:563 stop:937 length:375 start_codon:yes stop_codon:yes gene_type:complete